MRLNKKNETMTALKKNDKAKKAVRGAYALAMAVNTFLCASAVAATTAFASASGGGGGDDGGALQKVKDIMCRVGAACGGGLMIFGVYELVMAFLQSQPEAKTKGILMIVCGAVLAGTSEFV